MLKIGKPKRVLGIDHSTRVLAFCLTVDGIPEYWEEIQLSGATAYDRIAHLYKILSTRFDGEKIDAVAIEKTIQVNSRDTVVKMAMIAGVIIGYFGARGVKINEISARVWQAATANPTLSKADKLKLRSDSPKRSKSWYSNEERKIRKQRIIDWVKTTFNIDAQSDAADAICIAHYAGKKL